MVLAVFENPPLDADEGIVGAHSDRPADGRAGHAPEPSLRLSVSIPLRCRQSGRAQSSQQQVQSTSAPTSAAWTTSLRRVPVLLVGNHSGGTMIADTFVFAQAFYDHFGPERPFHQLARDFLFEVPGARALVQRYGTIPASRENMQRALDRDAALLVYPGGDQRPTGRPGSPRRSASPAGPDSSSSRSGRTSRLSPWLPSAARRLRSSSDVAGDSRARLELNRLLRLRVLPLAIGLRSASPCSTYLVAFRCRPRSPSACSIRSTSATGSALIQTPRGPTAWSPGPCSKA